MIKTRERIIVVTPQKICEGQGGRGRWRVGSSWEGGGVDHRGQVEGGGGWERRRGWHTALRLSMHAAGPGAACRECPWLIALCWWPVALELTAKSYRE